jgi:hypothetical protein
MRSCAGRSRKLPRSAGAGTKRAVCGEVRTVTFGACLLAEGFCEFLGSAETPQLETSRTAVAAPATTW